MKLCWHNWQSTEQHWLSNTEMKVLDKHTDVIGWSTLLATLVISILASHFLVYKLIGIYGIWPLLFPLPFMVGAFVYVLCWQPFTRFGTANSEHAIVKIDNVICDKCYKTLFLRQKLNELVQRNTAKTIEQEKKALRAQYVYNLHKEKHEKSERERAEKESQG